MTVCQTILALLAINDPMQVDENEMRLAVDLAAADMLSGERIEMPVLDEASHAGLMRLFNEHALLSAEEINGKIIVTRKWGR